jgi:hypothetical protein
VQGWFVKVSGVRAGVRRQSFYDTDPNNAVRYAYAHTRLHA